MLLKMLQLQVCDAGSCHPSASRQDEAITLKLRVNNIQMIQWSAPTMMQLCTCVQ